MNLSILVYVIVIGLFIFSLLDKKTFLSLFFIIFFSIPFGWSFSKYFHLYIEIGSYKISIHDFMFIYLLVLFLIRIFTGKISIKNKKIFIANTFFLVIVFIYTLVGINNNEISNVVNDFKNMIYYSTILILFSFDLKLDDVNHIIQSIVMSSIIFSFIDIIIFMFKDTLFLNILIETQWVNQSRIGFTNSIMIILILPLFFNKNRYKNIKYINIATIMLIFTIVIGQSITLLSITILICLLTLFLRKKKYYCKINIKKSILYSIGLSIFIIVIVLVLFKGNYKNSTLYESIQNLSYKIQISVDNPNKINSIKSRDITNKYAFDEFKNNIWGYGLGKTFTTFIQNGSIADYNHMFVDNLFYTLINKMGIIGCIYYIFYILIIIKELLHNYNSCTNCFKEVLKGFVISMIFMMLINITTAQMLISPITIITMQLIIYFSIVYKNVISFK